MTMARTKTFRSGNSEAVLLPKEIAFGKNVELVALRSGDVVTLYPATRSIADMIARLNAMPVPRSVEDRDEDERPE